MFSSSLILVVKSSNSLSRCGLCGWPVGGAWFSSCYRGMGEADMIDNYRMPREGVVDAFVSFLWIGGWFTLCIEY